MTYAIDPPVLPTLRVAGRSERFPLHRVCCVGRNDAAHARWTTCTAMRWGST